MEKEEKEDKGWRTNKKSDMDLEENKKKDGKGNAWKTRRRKRDRKE